MEYTMVKEALLDPLYILYNILDLELPMEGYPYLSVLSDTLDNLFESLFVYELEDETFSKLLSSHGISDDDLDEIQEENPLPDFLKIIDKCGKDILRYQKYLAAHVLQNKSAYEITKNYYKLLKNFSINKNTMFLELNNHCTKYGDVVYKKLCDWLFISISSIVNELVKVEKTVRGEVDMVEIERKESGEKVIQTLTKDKIHFNNTAEKRKKEELRQNVNELDKESGVRLKHPGETVDTDFKFKKKVEKYRYALSSILFQINEMKMKKYVEKNSIYGKEVKAIAIDEKFMKKSKWFDNEEVDIETDKFVMRFITYVIAWVIKNLAVLSELSYEYNDDGEFIEYESKLDYAKYISKRTMDFVTKVLSGESFEDDLLYFQTLMILLNINKDNHKKTFKKISNYHEQVRIVSDRMDRLFIPEQAGTMNSILKLAYMVSTNDPKVKGKITYNDNYKFYKTRETREMISELGYEILKSKKKYSTPELFRFFIYADPKIYSQWVDVNEDDELAVGIIAMRFLAYIMNDNSSDKIDCLL